MAALGVNLVSRLYVHMNAFSESVAGIIMSMHLHYAPLTSTSTSKAQRDLRLLCGYEDGGVVLHRRTTFGDAQTVEGKGWDVIWKSRLHVESGSSHTSATPTLFTNPRWF